MTTTTRRWRQSTDPLFRGDRREGIAVPDPTADPSIVRHILYLDGPGRQSPYLSTTEDRVIASRFAGRTGKVYRTKVTRLLGQRIGHLSRLELLQLLKGKGKGQAAWPSAYEVMTARVYVEEKLEHLLDFTTQQGKTEPEVTRLVREVFQEDEP